MRTRMAFIAPPADPPARPAGGPGGPAWRAAIEDQVILPDRLIGCGIRFRIGPVSPYKPAIPVESRAADRYPRGQSRPSRLRCLRADFSGDDDEDLGHLSVFGAILAGGS